MAVLLTPCLLPLGVLQTATADLTKSKKESYIRTYRLYDLRVRSVRVGVRAVSDVILHSVSQRDRILTTHEQVPRAR